MIPPCTFNLRHSDDFFINATWSLNASQLLCQVLSQILEETGHDGLAEKPVWEVLAGEGVLMGPCGDAEAGRTMLAGQMGRLLRAGNWAGSGKVSNRLPNVCRKDVNHKKIYHKMPSLPSSIPLH